MPESGFPAVSDISWSFIGSKILVTFFIGSVLNFAALKHVILLPLCMHRLQGRERLHLDLADLHCQHAAVDLIGVVALRDFMMLVLCAEYIVYRFIHTEHTATLDISLMNSFNFVHII